MTQPSPGRGASASPEDLLATAVDAARTAGDFAAANLHRRGERLAASAHDVKLRLDVECQALAADVIRRAFPEHAILGEEDAPGTEEPPPSADVEWVVDPIDGTVNFSHGLPLWCCSVAARRGEEALAAAVYAPLLREIYTATAAGPALCNGLPLRVSAVSDLGSAVVHTGLDRQDGVGGASFPVFQAVARAAQRPRVLGSAALDICRVAAGQADAYVETGVYVWDVAAAGLIVRRAGGRGEVLAWRDAKRRRLSYLASNGLIHSALRDLIVPFLPGSAGLAAATAP